MTKCEIILQQVKMSDLLERYGIYPKQNKKYYCIFHNDHNPSATISKEDKWFKCWSCGVNVNVIDFVAKKENCDRSTAIKIINGMFNLGLDGELTLQQKEELRKKKEETERQRKRKEWWRKFIISKLCEISDWLRVWEQVERETHPTRGEIKNNAWKEKNEDLFFQSLKQQHWLNWLYDRVCNNDNDLCGEYDYLYGFTNKEVLNNLYLKKIEIIKYL
ncbi:MAG: hypothetical protein EOL97_09790 [Spirochaetia bacterium]|nr:hypothetical protein [Spirochaetia bacterium]